MAEKKSDGKLADKTGKALNAPKAAPKKEVKEPEEMVFLVFFAGDGSSVQAKDARSAVKLVAETLPGARRFVVVEPDFVEVFTTATKTEVKKEDVEKYFMPKEKDSSE